MAKVFVGGLSWDTDDESLRYAFEEYGVVTDAKVITDRDTGRSRGFGFVTFETKEEADAAIEGLNDEELDGRRVRVNIAEDRRNGGGRSGNRGGGRGGNRGGGRGGW